GDIGGSGLFRACCPPGRVLRKERAMSQTLNDTARVHVPESLPEEPVAPGAGLSEVEALKFKSNGLGGVLFSEIADQTTERVSEEAYQLLKYHGSYQQEDRDQRKARKKQGLDRACQLMVRTKFPGGRLTAEQ